MNETPVLGSEQTDVPGAVLMWLVAGWLVLVVGLGYVGVWAGLEVMGALGNEVPEWYGAGFIAVLALLALLPTLPLAALWRGVRYRAIFQVWAVGALFLLGTLPLRLVPVVSSALAGVVQVALVGAATVALGAWLRRRGVRWGGSPLPALLVAPLLGLGGALWLALGSPLDILLNGLAALGIGALAGGLVGGVLMPALYRTSPSPGWNVLLGAIATTILLLLLGVAIGFQGQGVLLLLLLPALGVAVAVVSLWEAPQAPFNIVAPALLVAAGAAVPMVGVDPEELILLLNLGSRDVFAWAFQAVGWAALLGLIFGVVGLALHRWIAQPHRAPAWWGAMAGTWLLGAAVYGAVGQPGLHGDHLFVILREQADLSAAPAIPDREERLRFVYTTLTEHADRTQAPLRASLDGLQVAYQPYYLVNAIAVEGGPLHRAWLESLPEVDRVIANPTLRPLPEVPATAAGTAAAPTEPQWNLTLLGADRVWEEFGVRGARIVVGESDSGVQGDHPELADSYRGRSMEVEDGQIVSIIYNNSDYDWFDPWYGTREPRDIGGHGTHTLGSVVGNTVGVAPDAEWIGCVNLARNLGNPALYLDCLQFMLAPFPHGGDPLHDGDPAQAAHVLNNSWGCPDVEGCDPEALLHGVRALRAAGIFVVASAGNDGEGGCSTVRDPIALYDEVFTVGALSRSEEIASFSSLGPVTVDGSGRIKPDIVAPGVAVLSAFPGSTYSVADGTSMAGPHVAGVVALMWSANPALIGNIERTEEILRDTARPITTPMPECGDTSDRDVPNNTVGFGLVDAYAAVRTALDE